MNVSVRIHVEADALLDHEVFPPTRPGECPCAWVSIGHEVSPPAEFATHDVEALERLAAEFQAAASALRTAQEDAARIERETRRDHDHCDAPGCTGPVSGGIAGNGVEWQWCDEHRPEQSEIDAVLGAA
jgi:hypothetical protein